MVSRPTAASDEEGEVDIGDNSASLFSGHEHLFKVQSTIQLLFKLVGLPMPVNALDDLCNAECGFPDP